MVTDDAPIEESGHYQQIFEAAPLAIVFTDADRRIIKVNPAFERLFGYTLGDLQGKQTAYFYASQEEYEQQSREHFNPSAAENLRPHEVRYRKKDGTVFLSETLGSPVKNDAKQIQGYIGIIQDITERKATEEDELELDKQLNRMSILSKFITDVSHDFRHPLSLINTNLFFLQRSITDIAQQQYLIKIGAQVQRLDHLLNQMLTMTRLDSGTKFQLQQADIQDLIAEIVDKHHKYIAAHALQVQVRIADEVRQVRCDEDQLFAALNNIFDNALRFTPDEGQIVVRTYGVNHEVVIEVADTGIGIPSNELHCIFDRFYTVNSARTAGQSGSGLGLAIAKAIVLKHGGDIGVTSEPGKGSVFQIILPQ